MQNIGDSIRIIAVDPGETTGLAVVDFHDDKITVQDLSERRTYVGIANYIEYWSKRPTVFVDEKPVSPANCIVLYENFQNFTIEANFHPLKIIGMLEFFCDYKGLMYYKQQPQAQHKDHGAKAVMKAYENSWIDTVKSHKRSALFHALHFLMVRGVVRDVVYDNTDANPIC